MARRTGEIGASGADPYRGLERARSLAVLLDSSIPVPGTTRRIGLDPLLGLVPVVGDFAGAILSGYIVLAAAQAGAPTFTLIRMVGNITVDTVVGSLPLLGDLFDAAWKSNAMNIALFEKHIATAPTRARTLRQVSKLAGVMLVVTSLLAIALLLFIVVLVYLFVRHAVSGG